MRLFPTSLLLLSALAVAAPAVAANTPKIKNIRIREIVGDTGTTS